MSDASKTIAATEAKHAAYEGTTLEDKILRAMRATKFHWLLQHEPAQFEAACAGVLLSGISEEDKDRLTKEYRALSALSFAMEGAARGMPVTPELGEVPEPLIGLLPLWKSILSREEQRIADERKRNVAESDALLAAPERRHLTPVGLRKP